MKAYRPLDSRLIKQITETAGSRNVIQEPQKLAEFGKDGGTLFTVPELAVEATDVPRIQALLRLANQCNFPVTPRGSGTGLAGGSVPLYGGVVLSLAKMDRILSIEKDNLIAVVEPGVINLELKNAVHREGLFYPPDPASLATCSLGGNAATNAGGPACLKYGTTRHSILGLEAVLPSGELLRAGVQTRKGVVGYDLLHLLIGSEGTLGIITKLILKLLPHPQDVVTLVALFPCLTEAMEAVTAILTRGHIPSALEFIDHRCLELVGDAIPFVTPPSTGALLLIETDGPSAVIQPEIEAIGEICLENGAFEALIAADSQKRLRMWEIRREVSRRIEHQAPFHLSEDIVVPIGKIAEFVATLPEFEGKYDLAIYSFGHAGDGNIHLNITSKTEQSFEHIEKGILPILLKVISIGGTISGEHGIGAAKKSFLPYELSRESIRLQKGIKSLFDPNNVLNPGKIFENNH